MLDVQFFEKSDFLDQAFLKALQSKLFVQFCDSQFGLDTYIHLVCTMAYRRKPTWERLVAFTQAFLEQGCPLLMNTQEMYKLEVLNLLSGESEDSNVMEEKIKIALDKIHGQAKKNIIDGTYSGFQSLEVGIKKYNYLLLKKNKNGAVVKGLFSLGYKKTYKDKISTLSKIKNSDSAIKQALNIVKGGGFPTDKMGLSGLVVGM